MQVRPLVALVLVLALTGPGLRASDARVLESREGDNSIYFEWDHKGRRVTTATSSTRFLDESRVRIMTSLQERPDRISMRATLKNVSKDVVILLDGRLVHKIWGEDGTLIRKLQSRVLTRRLDPGEHVRARFGYQLPSGWYSARSDFKRR